MLKKMDFSQIQQQQGNGFEPLGSGQAHGDGPSGVLGLGYAFDGLPLPQDDDSDGGTDAQKAAKKSRKRQQTSCSDCHRRKQKCNKRLPEQEVPCDRCIKRGTAHQCKVMTVGDKEDDGEIRDSPPAESKRRKRKTDKGDELAARVKQLEDLIRVQNQSYPQQSMNQLSGDQSTLSLPSAQLFSNPEQHSAVEEAAVAALGQLSKATSKEGGSEARIYSGPGSVTDFLIAAGFGKETMAESDRVPRARLSDMRLYRLHSSIHNLANAPPRLTKLVDALEEQKVKLPPAQICHYLFDSYYESPVFSQLWRTIPRGSIQLCYDGLWEDPQERDMSKRAQEARDRDYPQIASSNSLAFLSLLFAMLASALSMSPDASTETHQLASTMQEASRASFMASERREQPTYSVIAALLGQSGWYKLAGCPSLGFTYIAQAIRFAQSMGLHREPGPKWGLGPFESELRRRTWWNLVVADRAHSLGYGRPYNISERHCDVQLPANINDEDLTAEGPVNIKPFTEVTHYTFALCTIRMTSVMAEIIDRAFSCVTPNYSTILELDNLITIGEHKAMPLGFKNPSVTDIIEKPYIKDEYTAFQIQFCWLRAMLHRPYLLRPLPKKGDPDHYAGSRAATIMLSQKMITLTKELVSHFPHHYLAYFGYAFWLFEPSVNLAMAIIQDPASPNCSAIDGFIVNATQLLDDMSDVNKVASEGYDSIQFMRAKYLPIMTAAQGASPIATKSNNGSSGGKPSPVSLTYSSGPSPTSSTSPSTSKTSEQPEQEPIAASTPNSLFNQFFSQYNVPSPAAPSNAADMDLDKLFSFDPTLYNSDSSADWLTQPMDNGGLDAWPMAYPRLEGETDFGDWKKMLGL